MLGLYKGECGNHAYSIEVGREIGVVSLVKFLGVSFGLLFLWRGGTACLFDSLK
jgi:hypothetical protein